MEHEYYNKYQKYKNKYFKLKQTGGATIYNLIKTILDSIKNNTFDNDEPIEPTIVYQHITQLEQQRPLPINNFINLINESSKYRVFINLEQTFKYIQIYNPTVMITDDSMPKESFEMSNYYLCKLLSQSIENINGVNNNIYWLINMNKIDKPIVSKITIPIKEPKSKL
jgi:hypothetical protein